MAARAYPFRFLTPAEVAFVDAAVARLIPADDLGPGAREADVACFIDGQLASGWGAHARHYRAGPWPPGTPEQGWQSPLTPREVYRAGIAETDAHCAATLGGAFHLLGADRQDDVLRALESGALALPSLSGSLFFALLWRNTEEGFFADPVHSGNRDKIGWRLIGFPGVGASDYATHMARFGVPYRVAPVSILDIRAGRVATDATGAPLRDAPEAS
jgi:gluconate 2-dehydrogenase gamma chain